ncbi:hypothetical protein RND81_11G009000 [Saponaria officinalis]
MKLVYNELAQLFFILLQWFDGSCSCFFPLYFNLFHILIYEVHTDDVGLNMSSEGSKASIRDFYAIILPSLKRLHSDVVEHESIRNLTAKNDTRKDVYGNGRRQQNATDREREEECGICLVATTKMVLPGCCHEMCINCYRNWNRRSESCPFCRTGIRRVKSEDLWVLTSKSEVIDAENVSKEELSTFYNFIQSLPKNNNNTTSPESLFWVYNDFLI